MSVDQTAQMPTTVEFLADHSGAITTNDEPAYTQDSAGNITINGDILIDEEDRIFINGELSDLTLDQINAGTGLTVSGSFTHNGSPLFLGRGSTIFVGSASPVIDSGASLNITTSDQTLLNFNSFTIAESETFSFRQPTGATLNLVSSTPLTLERPLIRAGFTIQGFILPAFSPNLNLRSDLVQRGVSTQGIKAITNFYEGLIAEAAPSGAVVFADQPIYAFNILSVSAGTDGVDQIVRIGTTSNPYTNVLTLGLKKFGRNTVRVATADLYSSTSASGLHLMHQDYIWNSLGSRLLGTETTTQSNWRRQGNSYTLPSVPATIEKETVIYRNSKKAIDKRVKTRTERTFDSETGAIIESVSNTITHKFSRGSVSGITEVTERHQNNILQSRETIQKNSLGVPLSSEIHYYGQNPKSLLTVKRRAGTISGATYTEYDVNGKPVTVTEYRPSKGKTKISVTVYEANGKKKRTSRVDALSIQSLLPII
ncbi:MAG: hypothetical protein HY586_01425 [Candidatus Omnitrophica bacterium]|nr:hypothetical protein [Candidatus Omnitrophota bacterium]